MQILFNQNIHTYQHKNSGRSSDIEEDKLIGVCGPA